MAVGAMDQEPTTYTLYAVIVHLDQMNSTSFGHYICYVRTADGRWYGCDDAYVFPVPLSKVLSHNAYMLFYDRDTPKPSPQPGYKRPKVVDQDSPFINGQKRSEVVRTWTYNARKAEVDGVAHLQETLSRVSTAPAALTRLTEEDGQSITSSSYDADASGAGSECSTPLAVGLGLISGELPSELLGVDSNVPPRTADQGVGPPDMNGASHLSVTAGSKSDLAGADSAVDDWVSEGLAGEMGPAAAAAAGTAVAANHLAESSAVAAGISPELHAPGVSHADVSQQEGHVAGDAESAESASQHIPSASSSAAAAPASAAATAAEQPVPATASSTAMAATGAQAVVDDTCPSYPPSTGGAVAAGAEQVLPSVQHTLHRVGSRQLLLRAELPGVHAASEVQVHVLPTMLQLQVPGKFKDLVVPLGDLMNEGQSVVPPLKGKLYKRTGVLQLRLRLGPQANIGVAAGVVHVYSTDVSSGGSVADTSEGDSWCQPMSSMHNSMSEADIVGMLGMYDQQYADCRARQVLQELTQVRNSLDLNSSAASRSSEKSAGDGERAGSSRSQSGAGAGHSSHVEGADLPSSSRVFYGEFRGGEFGGEAGGSTGVDGGKSSRNVEGGDGVLSDSAAVRGVTAGSKPGRLDKAGSSKRGKKNKRGRH